MTDPLDALRHTDGATQPDAEFRARLMADLRAALDGTTPIRRPSPPDRSSSNVMEITMETKDRNRSNRRILALIVGVAAAAVIGAALLVSQNREVEPAKPATSGETSTTIAPSTTSPAPTSTAVAVSAADDVIAQAGLLTHQDIDFIGGDWTVGFGEVGIWDSDTAAGVPTCAAFVDRVFESADRPATIRKQAIGRADGAFEQDVIVFSSDDAAIAMMDAIDDPQFPSCLADFSDVATNNLECCEDASSDPTTPHRIRSFGDQMVNLAIFGEAVVNGVRSEGEGAVVFVRVGRAVMWLNPPSILITGEPAYSDEQLEQALAISVSKLRAAQET